MRFLCKSNQTIAEQPLRRLNNKGPVQHSAVPNTGPY